MRLSDVDDIFIRRKKTYWLVSMFFEDVPDESKFWLCFSEEEARKKFDEILPLDIEIDTIQSFMRQIDPDCDGHITRQEIIDNGEWANPFGNPNGKQYNGYASIYRVRRFDNGKETCIGYGVPSRRS